MGCRGEPGVLGGGAEAGNYPEKCPVRIWERDIPLLIDLLISNNLSSMTFFSQRVFYELSVVKFKYKNIKKNKKNNKINNKMVIME